MRLHRIMMGVAVVLWFVGMALSARFYVDCTRRGGETVRGALWWACVAAPR